MTAACRGPLFSTFAVADDDFSDRTRRESFAFSYLAQAAILGVVVYFTSCVIQGGPDLARNISQFRECP